MMWGYDFSWGGMFLMMLSSTLWIALLIVLAWTLIRWLNRKTTSSVPPVTSAPSAIETLRQRYARGEIDTATFEQMRERLEAPVAPDSQQDNRPLMNIR